MDQDVYSGTFVSSDIESRSEVHSRYNFQCVCEACRNQWPTHVALSRNISSNHLSKPVAANVKSIDKMYKKITNTDWGRNLRSCDALQQLQTVLTNSEVLHPHFLKYQAEVCSNCDNSYLLKVKLLQDVLHKCLWDVHGRNSQ